MGNLKPRRILQIVPEMSVALGGPVISALNHGTGLQKLGFVVSYLTMSASLDQRTLGRYQLDQATICSLSLDKNRFFLAENDKEKIRDRLNEADILHIHGVWETLIYQSILTAADLNIPIVMSPCGMLDSWSLRRKNYKKKIYLALRGKKMFSRVSMMHAASSMERDELESFGINRSNITVNPLAVTSLTDINTSPDDEGRKADVNRPFRIQFFGRVLPSKGVDLLIEAFANYARESTDDVELVVTGPVGSAYLEKLKVASGELTEKGQVRFEGVVSGDEVQRVLREADLFVLPSEHENFGLSIIEALSAGTPVVVSEHTGIASIIAEAGVGAVCRLDVDHLKSLIGLWIGKKRHDAGCSDRCIQFVKSAFNPSVISDRWLRIYSELIAQ